METFITLSMRICRPVKERAWLSKDRFHSRIAATKHAAIDCVGLADSARYRSSMDSPDQKACSNRSMARRVRAYRNILSIAIAQTHTEQPSSPSMTAFTIQWACRNSAISETSDEASGRADCATSAGFMNGILSTQKSSICQRLAHRWCRGHASRAARNASAMFLLCRMEGLSEAEP
jgi:hypothetical protein